MVVPCVSTMISPSASSIQRGYEAPVWIIPCLEGATATRTSGSSIHPAVQNMLLAARAQPRSDIDDASLAVREGGRGRVGFAAERPLLCLAADRLPDGPVWTGPPCPSRRCRLRRSVGPILFRLSFADVWWAAAQLCCHLILPLVQVDDMPEQTVRRLFEIAHLRH